MVQSWYYFSAIKFGKAAVFRYSRYVPKISRKTASLNSNGDIRPSVRPTRAEIRTDLFDDRNKEQGTVVGSLNESQVHQALVKNKGVS
jgi:hypothetical protein